jgi:hypothetical protein
VGSSAVGAWIAQVAFGSLLLYGWALGELTLKRIAAFLLLWVALRVGIAYVPYEPAGAMVPSLVAVLDIVLVFMIFKGDVRLT